MGKRRTRRRVDATQDGPAIVTRAHDIEEFATGAGYGTARRYRNAGEHALTLLHARGKLGCTHHPRETSGCTGCDRYRAGDAFRKLYELLSGGGKDSTVPRVGGGLRPELSDAQQTAGLDIARIRKNLSYKNWIIVEALCGKGYSARDALVEAAIPFGNDGVMPRLCEALDELVNAIGRKRNRRAA